MFFDRSLISGSFSVLGGINARYPRDFSLFADNKNRASGRKDRRRRSAGLNYFAAIKRAFDEHRDVRSRTRKSDLDRYSRARSGRLPAASRIYDSNERSAEVAVPRFEIAQFQHLTF